MTRFNPDINHPRFGSLVTDSFDAGQVIGESVARDMFKRQDVEYELQYVVVDWKKEADPDNIPWNSLRMEEEGQHWRLVYRFYPEKKA